MENSETKLYSVQTDGVVTSLGTLLWITKSEGDPPNTHMCQPCRGGV